MKLPDFSHLRDIPGYEAILQAVLKTQIQLLVDHLHEQTGEETLILTASSKEGTMCFLGSETGQGFLEGRDEIKSQFLAHCIKGTSPSPLFTEHYPLYYRNFDSQSLLASNASIPLGVHQKRKHSPSHCSASLITPAQEVLNSSPKRVCVQTTELSANTAVNGTLVPGITLSNTFNNTGNQSVPTFSLQAVLINTGKCPGSSDSAKLVGTLESKDKNKKTLSSKIDEITERIRTKDEINHRCSHDDSVESTGLQKLDVASDFMNSPDDISNGLAPVLSEGHKATDPVASGKLKDVSRASHRKPKLPRFNIGEESDEEDNDLSNSSGVSLVDNILDLPDAMSIDHEDSVFNQVSLDEIGEGLLLRESVTDIPIVAYDNGNENCEISTNESEELVESPVKTVADINTSSVICKAKAKASKSDVVIVSGSFSEKNWVKCTMCPEKFLTQELLNNHLQKVVHTPKKYECDFCGRKFNQLRDMVRHRRIHTGERPFTCDICKKSFARKDNLKSHKVKHFKQSPVMKSILRPDIIAKQGTPALLGSTILS